MAHQLKISDLLQFAPFRQARLICGQDGLANPVKGVNVIEAPDVTDWVQPGDVLLTNLYSLDRLRPLDAFIEKVAAKKLSALIVKVGLFVQEVPEEIVEAARRHRLPIIEIPRDVLYRNIVLCISEHQLSERLGVLERFKEINDHFLSPSLANQGAFRILKQLETFIDNPVGLYDEDLQCLFGSDDAAVSLEPTGCGRDGSPYYVQAVAAPEAMGDIRNRYVFPVRVGEETRLYLTILELHGELEDVHSIAIESAINALALDFLKQQAVIEVEKQFRRDLVGDLLSGSALPASELHRRAGLIQWDLKRRYAVAVLGLEQAVRPAEAETRRKLDRLAQHLAESGDGLHAQVRDEHVVLFWPAASGRDWHPQIQRRFAELATAWARLDDKTKLRAGVGEIAAGIDELPRSYRQALDALGIGIQAGFARDLVFFHELGIYRLLCRFPEQQELRDLVPAPLQKLVALKPRARVDLLETLEAYILSSGNALETSRRLKVHPKTVLYRLDKIRSEAGIDLGDAEAMLMVQVGLKIVKMLDAAKAG